ncbi:hypothetical protein pEaSNUABM11_00223 [Erwinia phage pEa_SNUABM_11]|nr:hypothetical protein pEaSNUABM11_00223 [Erwinia phage pEa_SNUABM_11]
MSEEQRKQLSVIVARYANRLLKEMKEKDK